jgi:hypothetical protein
MTEAEWLAPAGFGPAIPWFDRLEFAWERATERKRRLLACGCVRVALVAAADPIVQAAVESVESFADGRATRADLRRVRQRLRALPVPPPGFPPRMRDPAVAAQAVVMAASQIANEKNYREAIVPLFDRLWMAASELVPVDGMPLLREQFGNPFRPVSFDPRWRTADVLGLARAVYADRVFDRLSLLADALMDAGCDADAVLAHCRGPGPHARGCWVVDLVLGKE